MAYILVVIILFVGVVESIRHRKLTVVGGVTGGLIGLMVFNGAGWTGLLMLAAFFIAGTMATSWQRRQKATIGMAQEKGGRRKAGQVIANGGVAGCAGLLSLFFPSADTAAILIAGALSSAIADTLSSELGTLYGKQFFNILTLKKDRKGFDGVVSLEGTLIGIAGSALIAAIYCAGFGWSTRFFIVVLAGTIGNLADSVLGAGLERKNRIGNNAVNFLNTLIGAVIAWLLFR